MESYTSTEISGDATKDVNAHVLELKLKALIMDTIHFIDIVEQLQNENARSPNDWIWQKQLRFYLNKKGISYGVTKMITYFGNSYASVFLFCWIFCANIL